MADQPDKRTTKESSLTAEGHIYLHLLTSYIQYVHRSMTISSHAHGGRQVGGQ